MKLKMWSSFKKLTTSHLDLLIDLSLSTSHTEELQEPLIHIFVQCGYYHVSSPDMES